MATETEQLRLAVTFVDPASEQIKKLRGEMENLTGGAITLSLGKTGQHAGGLANQFTPLVAGLAQGGSIANAVTNIVPMLTRSLGAAGAVVTAAVLNIDRYRKSLAEYGNQARELNIPAASLKKVEQEWKRAGMTDPQIEANRSAMADAMGEVQNQASNLTRTLQSLMWQGSEVQRNAIEGLMGSLRSGDYEGAVNAVKETGDIIYNDTLELTKSEVRAAEVRNIFYQMMGVDGFNLPMKTIVKATREEIEDLDKQIKQWGAFNAEVRRTRVAVENINWQIGILTANYAPAIEMYKSMLEAAKQVASGFKRGREFREQPAQTPRERWREQRERRGGARVQKQSYRGGNGSIGGAPIILASYQDSTEKIRDDVRETVILTEQFRVLNNILRGAGGGGTGAIRASLGMPPGGGGGGGGYGPSGTGTRGTGGGTTGPSTTQPSVPPSIPGMPGVRPGDTGLAAMVRAGVPKANLLASLQPTTPGGARPLVAPSMAGGAGGGVAGMIGAGAVGGTGGAPAGAGPRTDVGALRMPQLPYGVPYGSAKTPPAVEPGGTAVYYDRQDRSNKSIPASLRYNNPGAQWPNEESRRFGQTDVGVIGGNNQIAGFPTPVHGLASNIATAQRKYVGKTIGKGIWEWSGHHRSSVPGYDSNQVITAEMVQDPKFWHAMARAESGKQTHLSSTQIQQALDMVKSGSAAAYERAHPEFVDANKGRLTERAARGAAPDARTAPQQPPGGPGSGALPDQRTAAGGEPGSSGVVTQAQKEVAGVRKGKLDPRLVEALEYAALSNGLRVVVTSGGQRMEGARGATGSHRHDEGYAADFDIVDEKGRKVSRSDPRRLKFIEDAAAAGAGGAGFGYMSDPYKSHMGITGSKHVVDEGMGAYAGSAEERAAIRRGLARRAEFKANRKIELAKVKGLVPTPKPLPDPSFSFAEQAMRPRTAVDTAAIDRIIGGEVKKKINGNGTLKVAVKGPAGTKVTAEGNGFLKKTEVTRVKEPLEKEEPVKAEPKVERTASRTDEE